jgi:hypothetical protein
MSSRPMTECASNSTAHLAKTGRATLCSLFVLIKRRNPAAGRRTKNGSEREHSKYSIISLMRIISAQMATQHLSSSATVGRIGKSGRRRRTIPTPGVDAILCGLASDGYGCAWTGFFLREILDGPMGRGGPLRCHSGACDRAPVLCGCCVRKFNSLCLLAISRLQAALQTSDPLKSLSQPVHAAVISFETPSPLWRTSPEAPGTSARGLPSVRENTYFGPSFIPLAILLWMLAHSLITYW